jgi:ParB family transcriptional regulator, chromosome partitioning protein
VSGKNRPGGLGRGLGALIPTGPAAPAVSGDSPASRPPGAHEVRIPPVITEPIAAGAATAGPAENSGPLPVPGARFAEVPVAAVTANPKQPRQVFDEEALDELTHSIREFGVLQPIVVRERDGGYELIMGERRMRASQAAGLETVPAIIRDTADDALLRDALLENIHRAQLNALEEAAAYQQLLEEFGTTHEELAARIGRSRSQVSNTIRLLNLPVAVQRRVAAGVLSAGHARALLGLDDRDAQDELASRIVAEGLSVRATEELVSLAGHGAKPGRRSRPVTRHITAPAIAHLADQLADTFDTRVRVELGKRKGKITVEFASVDDLERIVAMMAPKLATRRDSSESE